MTTRLAFSGHVDLRDLRPEDTCSVHLACAAAIARVLQEYAVAEGRWSLDPQPVVVDPDEVSAR